jgi:hypothetical protein
MGIGQMGAVELVGGRQGAGSAQEASRYHVNERGDELGFRGHVAWNPGVLEGFLYVQDS